MPKPKSKKSEIVEQGETNSQLAFVSQQRGKHASGNSGHDENESANLAIILKELRDFRKDNDVKLTTIHEDINKAKKRIEEAEERIKEAESRIQTSEDAVAELIKLQMQLQAKVVDLESRSRRDNVRIYERLLRENLSVPTTVELRVERAHRAVVPRPPPGCSPRDQSWPSCQATE
ncbi:hypothetical protein WMY93_022013 [Mugilogobius chulae]|uniref:Uncharacterized protein n=1 Tax=Mugilogobius chulae TaxID=88201 RepID=A0AAW0NPF5_9GOBI